MTGVDWDFQAREDLLDRTEGARLSRIFARSGLMRNPIGG